MIDYGTSAHSYLLRAQRELASGEPDRLFYAALESRGGIEARLQEYLECQQHVPDGRKRDWQIARLGASVSQAFGVDKVARVQIREQSNGVIRHTFFYTPVTGELQKLGKRLGDYLHAVPHRALEDEWWASFRMAVEIGCHLLEDATAGNLLGPPLLNKKTGHMHLPMELPSGLTASDIAVRGDSVVLDLRYFETLADARGDAA